MRQEGIRVVERHAVLAQAPSQALRQSHELRVFGHRYPQPRAARALAEAAEAVSVDGHRTCRPARLVHSRHSPAHFLLPYLAKKRQRKVIILRRDKPPVGNSLEAARHCPRSIDELFRHL